MTNLWRSSGGEKKQTNLFLIDKSNVGVQIARVVEIRQTQRRPEEIQLRNSILIWKTTKIFTMIRSFSILPNWPEQS